MCVAGSCKLCNVGLEITRRLRLMCAACPQAYSYQLKLRCVSMGRVCVCVIGYWLIVEIYSDVTGGSNM